MIPNNYNCNLQSKEDKSLSSVLDRRLDTIRSVVDVVIVALSGEDEGSQPPKLVSICTVILNLEERGTPYR